MPDFDGDPSHFERMRRKLEAQARERELTPQEIAHQLDLVRERIRQIEAKALDQLRSPERARYLRALLANPYGRSI